MLNKDLYFAPAFGNRPHSLIGRSNEMNRLLNGLQELPGSRSRATLVLGQRGYGKTVMLLELAELARQNGFVVASPTIVSNGMLERIVEKIQEDGEELLKPESGKLSGGSVGFLGFSIGLQFEMEEQERKSFTYKLSKLCRAIEKKNLGVLILVDEVQANNDSLRELIIAYQEMVGEGRNIAIVLAGLPGAVSAVLNDRVLTFLNRAEKIELDPLAEGDVRAYFSEAFRKMGISLSDEMLEAAIAATEGSPYLMQLVGHYISCFAGDDGSINERALEEALDTAKKIFINDICKTTINTLSDVDMRFASAMAQDDGPSKIRTVAERMGVTGDYAQQYKKRLIDSGVIRQIRRGEIEFAIPYLKDYMKYKE